MFLVMACYKGKKYESHFQNDLGQELCGGNVSGQRHSYLLCDFFNCTDSLFLERADSTLTQTGK